MGNPSGVKPEPFCTGSHTHTRLVCWKWQVVFCRMAIPSPKESFDRKTSNAGLNHIIIHLSRNYFAPWCFSDQTSQQPQICFFVQTERPCV